MLGRSAACRFDEIRRTCGGCSDNMGSLATGQTVTLHNFGILNAHGPSYIEYKTSEQGKCGGNLAFEALYPQIDFYNGVEMKSRPASAADCAAAGQPRRPDA